MAIAGDVLRQGTPTCCDSYVPAATPTARTSTTGNHTLTADDELTVTRGRRHSMWNSGPTRVRFRWQTTPARSARPPLLQSLLLIWTYRNEWRPCAPPPTIALPLSALLAVPARLLGHRTHYPPLNSGGTP